MTKSHLIICAEDIKQLGSLSAGSHSPPYFSLILCCNIADVSEMVIFSAASGGIFPFNEVVVAYVLYIPTESAAA